MKKILLGLILICLMAIQGTAQKVEKGAVEITTKDKTAMLIDTTKMTITINGDEIMLNGEKIKADDPRLKKIKRINVFSSPGMPAPPPPPTNKAFFGVSTKAGNDGAQIIEVSEGSPAAKAGLKEEDIIIKINNVKIENHSDLYEEIGKHKPEDKITVELLREGKAIKKEVVLDKNKMPSIGMGPSFGGDLDDLEHLNKKLENLNKEVELYNFDNETFNKNFNKNFKKGFAVPNLPNIEEIYVNTKKPKLGISIEDVEEGNGVKIKAVNEGSPAEKAGLKVGDIITSVDKHEVKEVKDIKWQYFEAGQIIKIGINRNKESKLIEVKIPKKINSADL